MKTFHLSHDPLHTILHKITEGQHALVSKANALIKTFSSKVSKAKHLNLAGNNFIRSASSSLLQVTNEGIKQTFLGFDINIEFLALTIRSFYSSFMPASKSASKRNNSKHDVTSEHDTHLTDSTHCLHN